MGKVVELKVVRPVNPEGISFVRYLFGAIAGQLGSNFINKHRRTISKMITKLGYKISDLIKGGGYIMGDFYLELDDNGDPVKLGAKRIVVLKEVETIEKEITVEAPKGEE